MRDMDNQLAKRDAKGRMLEPLPGGKPITTANARSMVQKRWENYRRKAVEAIVGEAKSVDLSVSTGADAYALLAAKQFSALMDSDKPVVDQLEKFARLMTGNDEKSQRAHEGENASAPGSGQVSASVETLLRLVEQIEEHKRQAVDKARAIDGVELSTDAE